MPLLNPYWVLLMNLAGRFSSDRMDYLPREMARERLVEIAGEDFGDDTGRWEQWLIARGSLASSEFSHVSHVLPE